MKGERTPAGRFISDLLGAFDELGVDYAVLRNFDSFPEPDPESTYIDIDLFVRLSDWSSYSLALERTCAAHGAVMVRKFRRQYVRHARVAFEAAGRVVGIQIDAHVGAQDWHGFAYMREDEILAEKTLHPGGFNTVCELHQALFNWLDKLLWGGHVKKKYVPGMTGAFASHPRRLHRFLDRTFGPDLCRKLHRDLVDGRIADTLAHRRAMIRALRRSAILLSPYRTLHQHCSWLVHEISLLFRPPGVMIWQTADTGAASRLATVLATTLEVFPAPMSASAWPRMVWNVLRIQRVGVCIRGDAPWFAHRIDEGPDLEATVRALVDAYRRHCLIAVRSGQADRTDPADARRRPPSP